ncbi:MAG: cyclic peptide export ABC transporter [Acidobacteriota bacterium]
MKFVLRLSGQIPNLRLSLFLVVVAGTASGLAATGMIALINSIISAGGSAPLKLVFSFAALCIGLPVARFVAQLMLIKMSQSALLELRMRYSRRVLEAPLRQIETIGSAKLLATLAVDIGTIVDTLSIVPVLIMHFTVVMSCFAYLGWLDWRVLIQLMVVVVIGIGSYQLAVRKAFVYFTRSRHRLDEVLGQVRSMVEGMKELKMHRERRLAFLGSVKESTAALLKENRSGQVLLAATSSWGQVMFFLVIGAVVLVMPRFQPLGTKVLSGYTIILFQLMVPLEVLLNAFPNLSRASVATRKVEALGFSLKSESAPAAQSVVDDPLWQSLDLEGVSHTYRRENDESFLLGPLDLKFRRGELVFIVGGNGSGKTTLAKLLLGLYSPEAGSITIGGVKVTDESREQYRERFSAVFSDFFLFEEFLGLTRSESFAGDAQHYIELLKLESKVRVEEGRLSTVELSQGQRKRLALLTAYLEDRPLYLFDEWAADQDPFFKEVFYTELLPGLQRRGKTVFVISHDDRYFQIADRIIKLDFGQVESDLTRHEWAAVAGARAD